MAKFKAISVSSTLDYYHILVNCYWFPLFLNLFKLTVLGRLMSAFPLEPRFSRTLISAAYLGCLIEILSIISMLYVCPVFYVPVEKRNEFSDVSLVKFFLLFFKKKKTLS